MRRTRCILLILLLMLSFLQIGALAAEDMASPNKRSLRVDGKLVNCKNYEIDGEIWFKLRDLALALRNTGSNFSVGWDGEARTVLLTTGGAYEPTGSEWIAADGIAVPSNQIIRIDGEAVDLPAWNIGGYNYFRLTDLSSAFGFQTDYDESTNTDIIRAKALHVRNSMSSRMYIDEISGALINYTVVNDPAPWLIREEVTISNDGYYYREMTSYGEDGRILTVDTEGDGFTSTLSFSYDELGRETGRVQETHFDNGGENRSDQTSEYDIWGQLVRQVADNGSSVTTYIYDDRGNLISLEKVMETPLGQWTDGQYTEYNEDDNRTKVVSTHNGEITGIIETTYENGGDLVREEYFNAEGDSTYCQESVYSGGKIVQMTQNYGFYSVVLSTTYDENTGAFTTITESPAGTTTFYADHKGNALRQEWTDGFNNSLTVWIYDEDGRLARIETGNPKEKPTQVTEISYDEDGKLIRITYENGGYREDDNYEYDPITRKMIRVKATTYPVASEITLNSNSLNLPVGGTAMLRATLLPENALKETVTWSSSDEEVAVVDSRGIVTAVAPGDATLTATSERGLVASCVIIVTSD